MGKTKETFIEQQMALQHLQNMLERGEIPEYTPKQSEKGSNKKGSTKEKSILKTVTEFIKSNADDSLKETLRQVHQVYQKLPERMLATILLAVYKTKLNPLNEEIYIRYYYPENVRLLVSYRGWIKLIRMKHKKALFDYRFVYKGDKVNVGFIGESEYNQKMISPNYIVFIENTFNSSYKLIYQPNYDEDRGEEFLKGVIVTAKLLSDEESIYTNFYKVEELERYRLMNRAQQEDSRSGAWDTHFKEMLLAKAFKLLSKRIMFSVESPELEQAQILDGNIVAATKALGFEFINQ